ncbi:phosphoglycerate dehydrogenase [Rhizodiscina lignyota]|uniref:D-3-phosphoglycerate dehydrogenase n=1 Tax=Rhizodiscina lignyota TaxID=1504668 RepID=A0A9P4M5E0_9PEZI|nr:phosphoglycerate dehydrogenase [Rhizodiscina lignyota]
MPVPLDSASNRPKVLIPEKVSPDGLQLLQASLDVHERKGLSPEQLLEIIPEYEALIVRSETKVTAAVLEAAKKLKVVARAGVGVDNVDVAAATKRGIIVVNSPSGNINAAAEHTVALMMAVARNIGDGCASLKAGKWERGRLVGVELKSKTLGIIGLGKVGLTVARLASGFDMTFIAYDPYANPSLAAAASVALVPTLEDLLPQCDFLTIHTPLIASTKGMIGTKELATMKPTARVLNVARGGTYDETALLTALELGTIAGAGIDVFTSEPPEPDSSATKLIQHPKVVATPHLGASTVEAQENVSIDVCEQVISILAGQLPRSAVNAPLILPEEYRTLRPFVELVEKMGSVYTQLYATGAKGHAPGKNFRTTFDLTYEGALAELNTTKPLFAALVKGLLGPILGPEGINVNLVNAEIIAKERGILVNEQRSRENVDEKGYSSFITLKARLSRSASAAREQPPLSPMEEKGQRVAMASRTKRDERETGLGDQVIQGYVSANTPYISRLGRFSTNFIPHGNLLICRNFDRAGKIGYVGNKLGEANVNIKFMAVAPVDESLIGEDVRAGKESENGGVHEGANEALMILGVNKLVDSDVVAGLIGDEGVLDASVVTL